MATVARKTVFTVTAAASGILVGRGMELPTDSCCAIRAMKYGKKKNSYPRSALCACFAEKDARRTICLMFLVFAANALRKITFLSSA